MDVCLSSICRALPSTGATPIESDVVAMLESAAPYVTSAIVVVAPGDPLLALKERDLPVKTTLVEHAWEGYAKTRSFALAAAEKRAPWVLTCDSDDRYAANGRLPDLAAAAKAGIDAYHLTVLPLDTDGGPAEGQSHRRPHLSRSGRGWAFRGCGSSGLHEYLASDRVVAHVAFWPELVYLSAPPSDLSPTRYAEHARLLEIALAETPNDTRTAFYLAQSYRDAGDHGRALAAYVKRGNMVGGYHEENFHAWMAAGDIAWHHLGMPLEAVESLYRFAASWARDRAEPYAELAKLFDCYGRKEAAAENRALAALFPWPENAGRLVDASAYSSHARRGVGSASIRVPRTEPPAANLSDPAPLVLMAIHARDAERHLPRYLACIEALDYPKDRIHLVVHTNDNADATSEILTAWLNEHGAEYASVNATDSSDASRDGMARGHEWTPERFKTLGAIRQQSLYTTLAKGCAFYFTADVDNFVTPNTLRELVALDLPIASPLLTREDDPSSLYANLHLRVDSRGYSADSTEPDYLAIYSRSERGVHEVSVAHCTYLVRATEIPKLRYRDESERHEYVVFSHSARSAGVKQYVDNRRDYGRLTFA